VDRAESRGDTSPPFEGEFREFAARLEPCFRPLSFDRASPVHAYPSWAVAQRDQSPDLRPMRFTGGGYVSKSPVWLLAPISTGAEVTPLALRLPRMG
jgi:hypothetical protein